MPDARSAHAQIFPPWMAMDGGNVVAVEQRVQQIGCQGHDFGLVAGPDEVLCLKSLRHKPEPAAIPAEDLDAVATPVPEDVKRGVHWIEPHGLLDEDRETVHAVAEINRIAVEVNFEAYVEPEHGSLPSICTTVVNSSMLALPRSSSTPLDRRTCNESVISNAGANGNGAGTTGTKAPGGCSVTGCLCELTISTGTLSMTCPALSPCGSSAPLSCGACVSAFSRAIRYLVIHLRSRFALSPCSCATRATDTPGCKAASMSARFPFSS